MTTIDDRHCENSQQKDGDPMMTLTAADMSCQGNPEQNVGDTERLRAAATQALRILERTDLAPITAALLRAALEPQEGQASQTDRPLVSARAVSLTEQARCPT